MVGAVAASEWVMAILMAATAALSAFSFWQATTFAEEAGDRQDEQRIAQTLSSRDAGYLQALIDHDLRVLTGYCGATLERDAALLEVLEDRTSSVGTLVTHALRAQNLSALFQADHPSQPCAPVGDPSAVQPDAASYSVARAVERAALDPQYAAGGSGTREDNVAAPSRAERRLMLAAVIFAITLLLLTATRLVPGQKEQSPVEPGHTRRPMRWRSRWAALALVSVLAGAVLIVLEVAPGGLLVPAMAFSLATILTLPKVWRRVRRPGTSRADGTEASAPSQGQTTGWWAELVGALTLVGFAGAALGFSMVSTRERDALAEADRQTVLSERLLEAGEQTALRDLATVGELVELEARQAAANQLGGEGEAERIGVSRQVTERHVQATESGVRSDMERRFADPGDRNSCPGREATGRKTPGELLEESRADGEEFAQHVAAYSAPGTACAVLSAVSRHEAKRWGQRASTFTVALVVLGLAGFLLALAADPDWTAAPGRWLLRVGVVGALAGALVTLLVSLGVLSDGGDAPGRDDLMSFASEVAAGNVALRTGDCVAAVERLDVAIDRYGRYGPAFVDRAGARTCDDADEWLIAPASDLDTLDLSLEDLESARRLGVVHPNVLGSIAWWQLLRALDEGKPDSAALRRAEAVAADALKGMEKAGVPTVHTARFNLALAHLALGEPDAERLYGDALRCLDAGEGCPGGGSAFGSQYVLSALADLELVRTAPPETVDRYRGMLVSGGDIPADGGDPGSGQWDLATFPQEVQIVSTSHDKEPRITIVWYYRGSDDQPWSVIVQPSTTTFAPGYHAGSPVPTGHVLPSGEYRADVYQNGRRTGSVIEEREAPENYRRVVAPELGLSAVIPDEWKRKPRQFGVEAAYGPPDSSAKLILRRSDADLPIGQATAWLGRELDGWTAEVLGAQGETRNEQNPWFLGSSFVAAREYPRTGAWAGIRFSPYARYQECGGTTFMAAVTGVDAETAETVKNSLVLEAPSFQVPVLEGQYESPTFSLAIPAGWAAVERPAGGTGSQVVLRDCSTKTNIRASTEDVSPGTTVDAYVDSILSHYTANFDQFRLATRQSVALQSGERAIDITYTWVSNGTAVAQTQRYAIRGSTAYFMTFTVRPGDVPRFAEVGNAVLQSFAITSR